MVHYTYVAYFALMCKDKVQKNLFCPYTLLLAPLSPHLYGQKFSLTSACVKKSLKSSISVFLGKRVLPFLRQFNLHPLTAEVQFQSQEVGLVVYKLAPWHFDTFLPLVGFSFVIIMLPVLHTSCTIDTVS